MKDPVLVIMAAGLGSRYGGLKQIAPIDGPGHIIMDFSLYDAIRAGFKKAVFVINPDFEDDFRKAVVSRVEKHIDVYLAHQRLDELPKGYSAPPGRTKPWGTAHAVLCAKKYTDCHFAVINADDFYGAEAFVKIHGFLKAGAKDGLHAMIGYRIGNTLTEHGHVSRGICRTDGKGGLLGITEHTHIERRGGAACTVDGEGFAFLPDDTVVSMNMWGFALSMMDEIESRFPVFLRDNLPKDPLKCEYYLPFVVNRSLSEGKSKTSVLKTGDKWYGVTYREDMPAVRAAVTEMKSLGQYPDDLWL